MNVGELVNMLMAADSTLEVRVGDVAELDALHTTVGSVVIRGRSLVISPGDNDLWKDETLATEQLKEILYEEERDPIVTRGE